MSAFLCTYRNVPHSTTHLAPAHLVLAKAPCTHLAMTSPNVASHVKQQLVPSPSNTGSKVRKFVCGDSVMVRNFRPTSALKWQRGTVIKVHGELTYQVNCEGHQRQVHVDHLLLAPAPTGKDDTATSVVHKLLSPIQLWVPQEPLIFPCWTPFQ